MDGPHHTRWTFTLSFILSSSPCTINETNFHYLAWIKLPFHPQTACADLRSRWFFVVVIYLFISFACFPSFLLSFLHLRFWRVLKGKRERNKDIWNSSNEMEWQLLKKKKKQLHELGKIHGYWNRIWLHWHQQPKKYIHIYVSLIAIYSISITKGIPLTFH